MKSIVFSIIILNWNGEKWLKNCIDSILCQTFSGYEIILVDNRSSDNSVNLVRKAYPSISIVQNEDNYGYARGNNIGAGYAKGAYLFFLNTDTMLKEDCLEKLHVSISRSAQRDGIYALKLYSYDRRQDMYPCDQWMSIDPLGYPLMSKKVFYADGSALVICRELFAQLSGFDESHFMYAEDVDICWRAHLLGRHVVGVSESIVCHAVGGSACDGGEERERRQTSIAKRYYVERNTIRNLIKNYSLVTLFFAIPILAVFYLLESVLCLSMFRCDVVYKVYIKALLDNLYTIRDTLRERHIIQRQRVIGDLAVLKMVSWRSSKIEQFKHLGLPVFNEDK